MECIIYIMKIVDNSGRPKHDYFQGIAFTSTTFLASVFFEAPARTLAEKTKAFAEQHGQAFARSSMSSYGVNVKNAPWLYIRWEGDRFNDKIVDITETFFSKIVCDFWIIIPSIGNS